MKNENIPADIKSKSLKEARDEINEILKKNINKKNTRDILLLEFQTKYKKNEACKY